MATTAAHAGLLMQPAFAALPGKGLANLDFKRIDKGLLIRLDDGTRIEIEGRKLSAKLIDGEVGRLKGLVESFTLTRPDGSSLPLEDIDLSSKSVARLIKNHDLPGLVQMILSKDDRLSGSSFDDAMTGGANRDHLRGLAGADTLDGGSNKDTLLGGDGNDSLSGGTEDDSLDGGIGDDILIGGSGKDLLTGGEGADVFVFDGPFAAATADRITDFDAATDRLALDWDGLPEGMFDDAGVLRAEAFHAGVFPRDDAHRMIYDQARGILFYDPDGYINGGSQPRVIVAWFAPDTALTHEDITLLA